MTHATKATKAPKAAKVEAKGLEVEVLNERPTRRVEVVLDDTMQKILATASDSSSSVRIRVPEGSSVKQVHRKVLYTFRRAVKDKSLRLRSSKGPDSATFWVERKSSQAAA